MQAQTSAGTLRPISECYLRTDAVHTLLGDTVPYLALPDPNDPRWDFLGSLGVSVQPNLPTLLKHLGQLSAEGAEVDPLKISSIYSFIQNACSRCWVPSRLHPWCTGLGRQVAAVGGIMPGSRSQTTACAGAPSTRPGHCTKRCSCPSGTHRWSTSSRCVCVCVCMCVYV